MEKFVQLKYVLKNIVNSSKYKCILEKRPLKYKFGTYNYGEIIGLVNRADGDRWDIFAPGYGKELPMYKKYKIQRILGIYLLSNGNHKIAVRLSVPSFTTKQAEREIKDYCKNYTKFTKVAGKYINID